MAIHNSLCRISLNDQVFSIFQNVDVPLPNAPSIDGGENAPSSYEHIFGHDSLQYMSNLRDQIAQEWFDGNF